MIIYFSHPTFTFRTKTERRCIEIIKESYDSEELINPADFGLRKDPREFIKKADTVIGMAVSNTLTFLVWNEMKLGKKSGSEINTFMVESKDDLGPLVEGVPGGVERLDRKESHMFREKVLGGQKESIVSMLFGNWGRRF